MMCQRQRQELKKSLYVQKNLKSSIRLGCTSTGWSGANANSSDQLTARGRRQSPPPHQSTGPPHSAKFLQQRDFEGQVSLIQTEQVCDENRDSWWLLCELPQQRVVYDQKRPHQRAEKPLRVCMSAHAHEYIFIENENWAIYDFLN